MKCILSVLLAGVLATSATADNLMVSYAAPLAAYPAGGPPIVHPVYSYLAVPYYTVPTPFGMNYGYQDPLGQTIGNRYLPMEGYAYFGYAFSMPANPNIPSYAFGYSSGYAAPFALGFDGTTMTASHVAPAFHNELTTISDPYINRSNGTPPLNGSAKLTLAVPADAVVSIQGERMQQSGTTRTFITPTLFGSTTYDVKVMRTVDGKEQEQTMTVMLQTNQQSSITVLR